MDFLANPVDGAFPTHQARSIQLASGLLVSAPSLLSMRPSELGTHSLPSTTRRYRAELGLWTLQWEPPNIWIPYLSFLRPTSFSKDRPRQEPKSLSLPPSLPPSLSHLPEDFSAQLWPPKHTPKPRTALWLLESLGPFLECQSSTGHPLWALNYQSAKIFLPPTSSTSSRPGLQLG